MFDMLLDIDNKFNEKSLSDEKNKKKIETTNKK
jgi:hypothetical protein